MKILEFLQNPDQTFSSRRLGGITSISLSLAGKIVLFIYGLTHEIANLHDLDEICNEGLKWGCIALCCTTIDQFLSIFLSNYPNFKKNQNVAN